MRIHTTALAALPLASLLTAASLGCGAPETPTATPAGPTASASAEPAKAVFLTPGQLKVVHLTSPDGRVGVTVDRSGAKPKMQRDGSKDIVELTEEEDRYAGQRRGTYLVAPDGRRPLYLSANGHFTLFEGRDEYHLRADREAAPLGAATVAGAPKKEKALYEIAGAVLTPISVRVKMPQMKAEDASRLAKVEEALKGATKEMFVRYVVKAEGGWAATHKLTPDGFGGTSYGGVAHKSDDKWDPAKGKGLAKYGGQAKGFSHAESKGNHINVVKLDGYPAPLASGTPGLVWEVNETTATFVTLDGGRYEMSLNQKEIALEPGAGPADKWPAPVQHALLDIEGATSLVKVGELPKKAEDDLFAQDDEWNKCAQKVWAGMQRTIDTGKFNEALRKDTVKKAETSCAAAVTKHEKTFLDLVEARAKARLALFEKAKARVAEVSK